MWLSTIPQSEPCARPRHASHTKRCADWSNIRIYRTTAFLASYGVILPAATSDHSIVFPNVDRLRRDDLSTTPLLTTCIS